MVSFGFPRHFYLLLYYCLALFIFLLFAFCGKNKLTYCYQPQASADNPHLDLDYSGYHKNLIQELFSICMSVCLSVCNQWIKPLRGTH